jgi:hypothetical protein
MKSLLFDGFYTGKCLHLVSDPDSEPRVTDPAKVPDPYGLGLTKPVLGIRIRTFLQDPDPEIFHRIRIRV